MVKVFQFRQSPGEVQNIAGALQVRVENGLPKNLLKTGDGRHMPDFDGLGSHQRVCLFGQAEPWKAHVSFNTHDASGIQLVQVGEAQIKRRGPTPPGECDDVGRSTPQQVAQKVPPQETRGAREKDGGCRTFRESTMQTTQSSSMLRQRGQSATQSGSIYV